MRVRESSDPYVTRVEQATNPGRLFWAGTSTHAEMSELGRRILMRRVACLLLIHATSPCSCNGPPPVVILRLWEARAIWCGPRSHVMSLRRAEHSVVACCPHRSGGIPAAPIQHRYAVACTLISQHVRRSGLVRIATLDKDTDGAEDFLVTYVEPAGSQPTNATLAEASLRGAYLCVVAAAIRDRKSFDGR